jgi:hypothetical protein
MGYLISGHFVRRRPDSTKVRAALPKSIGFTVYEHQVHPAFAIDTYRATKPSRYPCSAATPATDISLDVSAELAAIYEQLRIENAANGLKRSYINLSRLLSDALNQEVLSVYCDDDGNDFACLSRDGEVVSGIAQCEDYILSCMKGLPIRVVGVHPVTASEPAWLIQAQISTPFDEIDWNSITQPVPDKDQSFWQVAYDKHPLSIPGGDQMFVVFFFHYLNLDRPLESAYGPLSFPEPTPVPAHLRFVKYEAP